MSRMTELFLSNVTLRSDPSVAALAAAFMPRGGTCLDTEHRAIWSLFSKPGVERDFLWRKEGNHGHFMILSRRRPDHKNLIFRVETRPFAPDLSVGDELIFHLRVNATVSRKDGPGRGKRHDVAMDLLRDKPRDLRAQYREPLAEHAARKWLAAQSDGFELTSFLMESYRSECLPRTGARPARFGVFDLAGRLRVTDPSRFMAKVATGFGRARAFGCGLMLIQRI
jgi:CRISPR system Cascade subunit CasE